MIVSAAHHDRVTTSDLIIDRGKSDDALGLTIRLLGHDESGDRSIEGSADHIIEDFRQPHVSRAC